MKIQAGTFISPFEVEHLDDIFCPHCGKQGGCYQEIPDDYMDAFEEDASTFCLECNTVFILTNLENKTSFNYTVVD